MAHQEKISSVRAAALLVATATNSSDFKDSKEYLLEEIQKAVLKGDSQLGVYEQAVKGLLLQYPGEDKEALAEQVINRLQKDLPKFYRKSLKIYRWLKWGLFPGMALAFGCGILCGFCCKGLGLF